ncbi:hypothetical protein L228DRAFT_262520 [Xylona heveae TC161]|uniref:Uncharacterized protein n=1 Tax=Xylona heveae (strain CBS 132557 / TC161) TaxID=1328760 RepID=A0A165AJL6_XYLHT|nr:hypothetical protein L228DRAFT_262520 [Xylona heveae TC161]KZF20586.1 hypothetical protein L228DRAFT_262520 [Xylona heveae TC161]
MPPIPLDRLKDLVADVGRKLDSMHIDYAIMGGAAVCLITQDTTRVTEDLDLVIQVDELFDHLSWPERPQYNLPSTSRNTINVNGHQVKTFSASWIFREKVLAHHQRFHTSKRPYDFADILRMIDLLEPGQPELNFEGNPQLEEALLTLLRVRPHLRGELKGLVKCTAVFGN